MLKKFEMYNFKSYNKFDPLSMDEGDDIEPCKSFIISIYLFIFCCIWVLWFFFFSQQMISELLHTQHNDMSTLWCNSNCTTTSLINGSITIII